MKEAVAVMLYSRWTFTGRCNSDGRRGVQRKPTKVRVTGSEQWLTAAEKLSTTVAEWCVEARRNPREKMDSYNLCRGWSPSTLPLRAARCGYGVRSTLDGNRFISLWGSRVERDPRRCPTPKHDPKCRTTPAFDGEYRC